MARLNEKLRQQPIIYFFAIAVFIEIVVMGGLLLSGGDVKLSLALKQSGLPLKTDYLSVLRLLLAVPSIFPVISLLVLQPLTPTLAAFITTAIAFKRKRVRQLIASFRFWSKEVGWRLGLRNWGVCLVTFAAMSLATAGLNHLLLSSSDWTWNINLVSVNFFLSFLVAMSLDIGGLGEEAGWRGFALPLLQQRMTPIGATLLLGLLWSLWHIPAKPDLLTNGFSYFFVFFGLFTIRLTVLAIVMSYFYNLVGGSTLLAIAMHGLHNDSVGLQGQILSNSNSVFLITEVTLLVPILVTSCVICFISKCRLGSAA